MKKIYVSCIPEEILKSSAKSLVAKLEEAFPHIDMDDRLTNVVSDAIFSVDETVQGFLGGSWLPEKELRLFVDVTLEKQVMQVLSNNLPVAEEAPTEE